jgi:hypothetical protein
MLDLDEDNELPPEAFDWRFAPREARQRGLTDTERTRKKRRLALLIADADLYNELLANYGRHVLDRLIEEGITARAFLRAVMLIEEDLDLWLEATGERLVFRNLGIVERLGLESWLWERHDSQRQEWRYKPDRRLNDRPDQEFIAHPSKQLWHGLHDFAGLVGDRYSNVWPGVAAICEIRKRQSRAQRTTRDARVRNLRFKNGKKRLTLTAWPASDVRRASLVGYTAPKLRAPWQWGRPLADTRTAPSLSSISKRSVREHKARDRLRAVFLGYHYLARENGLRWAAVVPDKRPSAWALRYVEEPGKALSAACRRLAPLRRLWRERLPDDDDLDRLAMSAAIEARL